jgi:hypothetical protein
MMMMIRVIILSNDDMEEEEEEEEEKEEEEDDDVGYVDDNMKLNRKDLICLILSNTSIILSQRFFQG